MSTPRIDQAQAIVSTVKDALTEAELDKVEATTDAKHVLSGSRHGVVVVGPPQLKFPTFALVEATWEVHIIAGPADNYLAAWATIDTIIQALLDANFPVDSGEPGQFQPLSGPPLWAYTLTLTTSN